jgi:hypothetical protein
VEQSWGVLDSTEELNLNFFSGRKKGKWGFSPAAENMERVIFSGG